MNPVWRIINWILCHIFNYHEWDDDWTVSSWGSYRLTCKHCGYVDTNVDSDGITNYGETHYD